MTVSEYQRCKTQDKIWKDILKSCRFVEKESWERHFMCGQTGSDLNGFN